ASFPQANGTGTGASAAANRECTADRGERYDKPRSAGEDRRAVPAAEDRRASRRADPHAGGQGAGGNGRAAQSNGGRRPARGGNVAPAPHAPGRAGRDRRGSANRTGTGRGSAWRGRASITISNANEVESEEGNL